MTLSEFTELLSDHPALTHIPPTEREEYQNLLRNTVRRIYHCGFNDADVGCEEAHFDPDLHHVSSDCGTEDCWCRDCGLTLDDIYIQLNLIDEQEDKILEAKREIAEAIESIITARVKIRDELP